MRVFISYHREDSNFKDKITSILEEKGYEYYSVPENAAYNGKYHQDIKDKILENMVNCTIVLCIVGRETYSRPHVDWEIHAGLKGGVGIRKGLLTVMLETRPDSKNNIDYETFPNRIQDNEEYAVLEQFASINDRIVSALKEATKRRKDNEYEIDNTREPMPLRSTKYYDN